MENTEETDIDVEDIGTILKSSRLKQKKSMEEISSELCIRKIYLTAIEEGDYETLPPIPYGIGYVRTYAKYLGLNPERSVKLYKAASQVEEQENQIEVENVPEVNKSSSMHIVVGILAIIIVYGLWHMHTIFSMPSESESQENIVTIEENVVSDMDKEEKEDSEVVKEETTENATTKEETSEIQETKKVAIEEKVVNEEAPNTVVLEFKGDCWVELKDKNKVYVSGVYHTGNKKEITYTDNLYLSVGVPANVKLYIKGVAKNFMAKGRKTNIPLSSLD